MLRVSIKINVAGKMSFKLQTDRIFLYAGQYCLVYVYVYVCMCDCVCMHVCISQCVYWYVRVCMCMCFFIGSGDHKMIYTVDI